MLQTQLCTAKCCTVRLTGVSRGNHDSGRLVRKNEGWKIGGGMGREEGRWEKKEKMWKRGGGRRQGWGQERKEEKREDLQQHMLALSSSLHCKTFIFIWDPYDPVLTQCIWTYWLQHSCRRMQDQCRTADAHCLFVFLYFEFLYFVFCILCFLLLNISAY